MLKHPFMPYTVGVCLVGFLVASLGMYAVFQPNPAKADCNTVGRVHDSYQWSTLHSRTATGNSATVERNCSRCTNYPASDHTEIEVDEKYNVVSIYKHRWFWDPDWTHCHSHSPYYVTYTFWYVVLCNQSGGGG